MKPTLPSPPCCCDTDPVEGLKRLFVDYAQGRTIAAGRDPATRPVFLRLHGVAHGRFVLDPGLPEALRVGLFGQGQAFPAWVRFSADVQPGRPDLKGTVGIAIKLFGVEGTKLVEPDQTATTHDFILQNHDVFFADTAHDMCAFTCASLNGGGDAYLASHPVTRQILADMEKTVESALTTTYWSGLPYAFGAGRYVKYKLEPVGLEPGSPDGPPDGSPDGSPGTPPADFDDPTYLRADLHRRLARGEARFRFSVQFQTDAETMPLDAATVRWSEGLSPPIPVATLVLPPQDLDARGQATYGENLAFNPWHALAEHTPVGSIADARRVVYQASAAIRRNVNGVPLGEPSAPRPPQYAPKTDYPAGKDTRVVRAAIHPAIGIARVGNSADGYFVGPQVCDPPARPAGFYRDEQGALKREAAEFRIYGYNAAGEVVSELTAGTADIRWSVHVCNRKAEWFQWQIALDIPEAADVTLIRRNAQVSDRASLVIDAGVVSIRGTDSPAVPCVGQFTGVDVKLGELRTDASGRLHFLGGHGVSASPTGAPIFPKGKDNAFINADGWYDDTCDGTVDAQVRIEGRDVPVESAWVVTAPPNYAPQLKGQRTLYDLLHDLYVQAGWSPAPGQPSFVADVQPILARLSGLQWVNQGFATLFGHGGRFDFTEPAFIEKLARLPAPGAFDPNTELRRQVLNSFRPPVAADGNQMPWPWIYGDAMETPAQSSPRQNASITATQHAALVRWAAGDFVDDRGDAAAEAPTHIDQVPLADQPALLDRAALDFCLADAFHPGCELTWPMRHLTMYRRPFRVRRRSADEPPTAEGATLTSAQALGPDGPLHAQRPGDLSRWMGLPWQADTAYCRAGYEVEYDPFAPTFWPARVPNQVLAEDDYRVVIDAERSLAQRTEAFVQRTNWNQPLRGSTAEQMEQMVKVFGSMGLVEVRPGVTGSPDFPETMMVASFGPEVDLKAGLEVAPEAGPEVAPESASAPALLAAATAGLGVVPAQAKRLPRGANFSHADEARAAPRPIRRGPR